MGGAGAHGAPAAYTRVCVKNVPKHVNEARLKEHFAAQGEVTDVKLLRTRWVPPPPPDGFLPLGLRRRV